MKNFKKRLFPLKLRGRVEGSVFPPRSLTAEGKTLLSPGRLTMLVIIGAFVFLTSFMFVGCDSILPQGFKLPGGIGSDSRLDSDRLLWPDIGGNEERPDINSDNNNGSYLLYYPDYKDGYLIPVTRQIPPVEGVARAVLEGLVGTNKLINILEPLGLSPLLSPTTVIRGINIEDGLATVNFSASFMDYHEDQEKLLLNSIMCTLSQFSTIERVQIDVEGVNLNQFPGFGAGQFPLGPDCRVNLEVVDGLDDYSEYSIVKAYFCHYAPSGRVLYVPVSRAVNPVEDELETAILELLKGPRRGSGLFSDIPKNVSLLGVEREENLVTIDFSTDLTLYRGGLTGENNVLNQIVLTLTSQPDVDNVKILINGESTTLPGGTNLKEVLMRPVINYVHEAEEETNEE